MFRQDFSKKGVGEMYNFTVGPVSTYASVMKVAGEQVPYFRTPEFSSIMLENEKYILEYLNAPIGSKCAFLTTSGTGGMEACVAGLLSEDDKVGIINGGTFGHRFLELCKTYSIPSVNIECNFGEQIKIEQLKNAGKDITALLVNADETSSGILYDMKMISEYCKANNIFLIVDAISSFLADKFDMSAIGANAVIIASQKALALHPGLSIIALDRNALNRVYKNKSRNMYLNIEDALNNMQRGQTPFTPAVSILLQLNARLKMIRQIGGVDSEVNNVRELACYFRNKIIEYPFDLLIEDDEDRSNAVTAVCVRNDNARLIVDELKDKYDIWVCPNGGKYANTVFRVGHIGALTKNDYDVLFDALDKIRNDIIL